MNVTNDGGPAFPSQPLDRQGYPICEMHPGMSIRDLFAVSEQIEDSCELLSQETVEALAGRPCPTIQAGSTEADLIDLMVWNASWRARLKYIRADAMLRARERGQEGEQGGEKVPSEELPDEHWHKIQTRPSLSWHPARGWEAACELRGTMMYGRGKTIAQAQAALRAEWEGGAR